MQKFNGKLIITDDVLKTLQQLAGYHRNRLGCTVLAITGSNGKTTTKELAAAALGKKFKTSATKGNLNNHIGVPLTLLDLKSDIEFAVVEMGANHQGEIASYCEYANPGYGLITNVGLAHTEGFGGFEGVVKGKTELYKFIIAHNGKLFVNADDNLLLSKISGLGYNNSDINQVITYGGSGNSWCSGTICGDNDFLTVEVKEGSSGILIKTNLIGNYNFYNVMSAICIAKYFGVEMERIKEAVESYMPSNNRSQKITYGTNTIILDAYNANPASMAAALQNFSKIQANNKVVILGEMMELGDISKAEHEKVADIVNKMELANKIFVGKGFNFLKNQPGAVYFDSTDELKIWFKQQRLNNCYMLVKGSRKNELEKIFKE